MKALADDPAVRYAGVQDLSADVSAFLSGRPVRAHREGPLEWAARQAGRYRTPLLLVGAYLAMRMRCSSCGAKGTARGRVTERLEGET